MKTTNNFSSKIASALLNTKKIFISLFTGVGGFELVANEVFGENNISCAGYSEIDKYAIKTYEKNFKGNKNLGDVKKIDWKRMAKDLKEKGGLDIIFGGSPCQSFSTQGLRKGMGCLRGQLIFDYILALKTLQPKAFVFENVKGLLSIDKGKTFNMIIKEFEKAGYKIYHRVFDAKDFDTPQHRERLFVVGARKDIKQEFNFEENPKKRRILLDFLEKTGIFNIISNERIRSIYRSNYMNDKPQNPLSQCRCLTKSGTHRWILIRDGEIILDIDFIKRFNKKKLSESELDGLEGRYLTINEIEAIQGFPKDFTSGVSNTQRYGQIGNSLSINVVRSIIRSLDNLFKSIPPKRIKGSINKKATTKARNQVVLAK